MIKCIYSPYKLTLLIKLAYKMFQANNTFGSYHRYVNRVARETVHKSRILNDGTIPERVYKKIQWYMVESVVMGEILANLTDHLINNKEKESLIYLGSIMAIFDVITDDFKMAPTVVADLFKYLISRGKRTTSQDETAIEKVFHLYLDKLNNTIEKEHWLEMNKHFDIIQFQMQSDRQLKGNLTEEGVTKITMGKGGVSILLCSALLLPTDDSYKKALFELGGFIQMMNDCQDIYKDTIEGITTFVHFRKSFSEIFDKMDEQRKITFHELKSLSCSYRGRSETIFYVNAMFIVISYKLQKYAEACCYSLDFKAIAAMRKNDFRINPFSPGAIAACFGRIMRHEFENCDKTPNFKFNNH
jgi:hypothetical protein